MVLLKKQQQLRTAAAGDGDDIDGSIYSPTQGTGSLLDSESVLAVKTFGV